MSKICSAAVYGGDGSTAVIRGRPSNEKAIDVLVRLQRAFLAYCHDDDPSVVALIAEALQVE